MVKNNTSIDSVKTIYAGKFRRYYKESWLKRITDVKTIVLNVRDLFLVIIGFFQSLRFLMREKPDAIFLKGSYEGLPMGVAAAILRIPYMTHDSDSISSLTNRIVGRWAKYNSVGIETGHYPYASSKVRFVGVPVAPEFHLVDKSEQASYRKEIGIPKDAKMILITGGSLGASRVNVVVDKILKTLIHNIDDLYVVLQVGKGKLKDFIDILDSERVNMQEFIPNMYKYSGAADVVISRGGANTIAELSVQAKACIIIPNPTLTGGHQSKNAEILYKSRAIELINEPALFKNPELLLVAATKLLKDDKRRQQLSKNIRAFAQTNSASEIASLLISLKSSK